MTKSLRLGLATLALCSTAAAGTNTTPSGGTSDVNPRRGAPAEVAIETNNWPQFRGPASDGGAVGRPLPLKWSEKENICWKTLIHDFGHSSPVVWGDQVWVTTATRDGKRLYAVCCDRVTGRIVHDTQVFEVEKPEGINSLNTYATPTPVIEEGRIYVHFGTYGTACLDTRNGQKVWDRTDLHCHAHPRPRVVANSVWQSADP